MCVFWVQNHPGQRSDIPLSQGKERKEEEKGEGWRKEERKKEMETIIQRLLGVWKTDNLIYHLWKWIFRIPFVENNLTGDEMHILFSYKLGTPKYGQRSADIPDIV